MIVLEEFFAKVREDVDKTLDELIPSAETAPTRLHEAVRWSVFAGGKRIRPAILIAVGKTFGAVTEKLLNSAAAVEMIHTYSLIHDDLPAMDDDDLRRGKATCHKQFDEATAILAGDVLQTLAFKAIADDTLLTAETRVGLISLIGDAAGTPNGMVSGQQLDLDAEGRSLQIDEIEQIHRQKTGALISASALAGAVIGGATEHELAAIDRYAANLGLLFQITDDLLDVTQPTTTLGKTAGKDAAAAKATYPGHYGVDATRDLAANYHKMACDELSLIDKDTLLLDDLARFIIGRSS
ncbi:MAG: polyprenyl synthetase family protein [Pyrinomonadaceae bacterium]